MTQRVMISGQITGTITYEFELPDGLTFSDVKNAWVKWDNASIELHDGTMIDNIQLAFMDETTDTKRPEYLEIIPIDDDGEPIWEEAWSVS